MPQEQPCYRSSQDEGEWGIPAFTIGKCHILPRERGARAQSGYMASGLQRKLSADHGAWPAGLLEESTRAAGHPADIKVSNLQLAISCPAPHARKNAG